MNSALISICIPAYKRIDFLKRLLDSVMLQSFKNFEVIVTDDSPSDDVRLLCDQYKGLFTIYYHKNTIILGTPENWNESIRRANGQWIKLMHDDDWFSNPNSLEIFAAAIWENDNRFIFSSYTNVYFPEERMEIVNPSAFRLKQLNKEPLSLLSKNIIGPPSVTLHRNGKGILYDKNIKWLVDIDFYDRKLSKEKAYHIDKPLVNVGLGAEQVTMMCHTNPEIEIPENLYLLKKTGAHHLKNILVYDAWWRLLRNLNIKDEAHLQQYVSGICPDIILQILKDLKRPPTWLLRVGIVSKLIMSLSYYKNRSKIK